MKNVLIIIGAIVLAIVIAGGSFYGGMAYQRNQEAQVRASFFASRGGNGGQFQGGQFSGGTPSANGGQRQGGFGFGGGTVGQVKSIDGSVLMLSTAQNVTTVNLTPTTRIEKYTSGSTSDLQPGERVTVSGERDSNGNITATQIMIIPSNPTNPSPTGTP
jgi:Domain of unknown function (DUF5666)